MKLFKIDLTRRILVGATDADSAAAYATTYMKLTGEEITNNLEVAISNDLTGLNDGEYVSTSDNSVNLTVADCKKLLDQATDPEFAEFQRLTAKFLSASLEVDPVLFAARLAALKGV